MGRSAKDIIQIPSWRQLGSVADLEVLKSGWMHGKADRVNHRVNFTAVILVLAGHGDYRRDDDPPQPVGPGSLFVIHPDAVFDFGPGSGETWEERHLCLRGERVAALAQRGWIPYDGQVYTIAEPSALVFHFKRIEELLADPSPAASDRCALYAEQLLLEAYHDRIQARRDRLTDPTMEAVLDQCRREFASDIDFHQIAEDQAISYSLLRQRIRRITGQPPQQYLIHLRCEEAQRLLWNSDLPIKAIADQVGIPDPYAFSRTFKRTVGISPKAFRQQSRASW